MNEDLYRRIFDLIVSCPITEEIPGDGPEDPYLYMDASLGTDDMQTLAAWIARGLTL